MNGEMSEWEFCMLNLVLELEKFGYKIDVVIDEMGKFLVYYINKILMCVNLLELLVLGEIFFFWVKWYYYLIDCINLVSWGRGGYEYFEKDDNYFFIIV